MKAILKHIFRSASKNKAQAVVIIMTIVIITVMFFVSFSLSDLFFNINMVEYDRVAQGADMLLGSSVSQSEAFSKSRVERLIDSDDVTLVEYFYKINTILRTETLSKPVLVEATDLNKYLTGHELKFIEKYDGKGNNYVPGQDIVSEYKPAIIGNSFALQTGLKVGDTIEIYLPNYDFYVKLAIMYIATDEGIFSSAAAANILCDFSAVANHGQVNAVYLTFKDSSLYSKYETIFEENLAQISISEGNNITYVRSIVRSNTMLLTVGLLFLIATMMLIQFTAYLIIARNRVNETVIFKAAGATPNQITLILLFEVIIYGLIGIIFGLAAGRLAMEIIDIRMLEGIRGALKYPFWKYIVSAILSLIVTIGACLFPVLSQSKRSVREMTSTSLKESGKEKPLVFAIMSVLLIIGAVLMSLLSGLGVIFMSVAVIIVIAFWIAYGITFIIKLISLALTKISKTGSFSLSGKTVKKNRALHTICVLFAVIIAFSFTVVEVMNVVKAAITPYTSRYEADYVVLSGQSMALAQQLEVKSAIESVDGIKSDGFFNQHVFKFLDDDDARLTAYGVYDTQTMIQCTKGGLSKDTLSLWETTAHPIVINQDVMLEHGLKVGDTISLLSASSDYSYLDFSFVIVGIDYTVSEYDKIGYVKYTDLTATDKTATHLINFDTLSELTQTETFVLLRSMLDELKIGGKLIEKTYVLTFDEWANAGRFDLQGVNALLTLLQIAIYFISTLGIVNIAIVTVYDRRHELMLYRLSGMSRTDFLKFSLGESLVISLSGSFVGIIVSFIINRLLPSIGALINKYLYYSFFPVSALAAAGVGIALFIGLWFLIALFNNRNTRIKAINERFNN